MRHRVADTVRPRRISRHLERRLAALGVLRSPEECRDIVGRLYGYPGYEAMEADIGTGAHALDDLRAGPAAAAARRAFHVTTLMAEGVPESMSGTLVDALAPTGADGPRPLVRDAIPERLRTPRAVRSALRACAARIAEAGSDVVFSEGTGEDGAWHAMSGSLPQRGVAKPFRIVVHAEGRWVRTSLDAESDPEDMAARRIPARRRRDDLTSLLSLIGFLDAPHSAVRPVPGGTEDRARRLLARLDADVLCALRTIPRFGCDLYEMMKGEPSGPGTARDAIRKVPLLAGFAAEFVDLLAYGFMQRKDTTFGRMDGGVEAYRLGHGMFRAPEAAAVERVLDALESLDPRLGNRMGLAPIRHLCTLPPDAAPVAASQAEAMFDCVDALLRFEEDGMPIPRIYEGLVANDWDGFARNLVSACSAAHGGFRLFGLLDCTRICGESVRRLSASLLAGVTPGLESLDDAARQELVAQVARRITPGVLRHHNVISFMKSAASRDTPGSASAGMLPPDMVGLGSEAILEALGCPPEWLAQAIRRSTVQPAGWRSQAARAPDPSTGPRASVAERTQPFGI